jgi:hypothetical protein
MLRYIVLCIALQKNGVVGAFVLHVIFAIETLLVALLLIVAHGTCVPIFHIKPTAVADILVCKRLHNVGKMNPLPLLCRLNPGQDVWDHVASHEWIGGHWDASSSSTMATSGMASMATPSATAPTTPLLVLLLETLRGQCGIDFLWAVGQMHCCVVWLHW